MDVPMPVIQRLPTVDGRHELILSETATGTVQANLCCVDTLRQRVVWRRRARQDAGADNAYVGIRLHGPGLLYAWDWDGYRETLDVATGRVLARAFMK